MKAYLQALVCGLVAGACSAHAQPVARGAPAAQPVAVTADRAQMLPFAAMLNELSQRRRRVVYTDNPLSLYDGASVNLVQVGAGNLSFRRVDLVTRDLLPVTVARVYDSRRLGVGDFGRGGWALSLAERIEHGSGPTLVLESGAHVALVADGSRLRPRHNEPVVASTIERTAAATYRALAVDGVVREYAAHSDPRAHELARLTDRFGNRVSYRYDSQDRLRSVSSAARSVRIERDQQGRIRAVEDDAGRSVRYQYDAQGFLARVIDAAGHPWHYEYDTQGRLVRAVAPGGPVDLEVGYGAAGRVTSLRRNGLETAFAYEQPGEEGASGMTLVRSGGLADRLFGHNAAGVTTVARTVDGPLSRLELNDEGRPTRIQDNGADHARFRYDAQQRLLSLHVERAGAPVQWRYRYGADGLEGIVDASGRPAVSIQREDNGTVVVTRGTQRFAHTLSAAGAVTAARYPGGDHYAISSDATGHITGLTDALGQTVTLSYQQDGRLTAAVFPGGEQHRYQYDALGLRTLATRSGTHTIRYDYTPEGVIHRYEVTDRKQQRAATSHRFDADQRLIGVLGPDYEVSIDYAGGDHVRSIKNGPLQLQFDYDHLGRLQAVSGAGERWAYRYAPGEIDLVARADSRRGYPAMAHADAAAALYDRVYLRRPPNLYGPARLNVALARFDVDGSYGIALPGDDVRHALQAMGLVHRSGRPLISAVADQAHPAFESPSNLLFVPAEYWAVNCVICFGMQPQALTPARAAAPTLAYLASQLQAICDVDINVPAACDIAASGLPNYMCDATSALVRAELTPDTLPNEFIQWTTNAFLAEVPAGATGATARVRATLAGGAAATRQGFVTASYDRQGLACAETLDVPVINNDPVNYAQLTDAQLCPERQQDTSQPYAIDGCSISSLIADFILSGDPQDPIAGAYYLPGNPTTFGVDEGVVPYGTATASLPCNQHDVCYQTCGRSRGSCDSSFYADMLSVCDASYPQSCPFTFASPACLNFELQKIRCAAGSAAIYQVVAVGAAGPYRSRQVQHCNCCPP